VNDECPHVWVQILARSRRVHCHDCGAKGPAPTTWISSSVQGPVLVNVGVTAAEFAEGMVAMQKAAMEAERLAIQRALIGGSAT